MAKSLVERGAPQFAPNSNWQISSGQKRGKPCNDAAKSLATDVAGRRQRGVGLVALITQAVDLVLDTTIRATTEKLHSQRASSRVAPATERLLPSGNSYVTWDQKHTARYANEATWLAMDVAADR